MSAGYYEKKAFCYYTIAILNYALKEIELNEGINFNSLSLSNQLVFSDVNSLLKVLCICLSETYEHDIKQLEYLEPQIFVNITSLLESEDWLIGNEFSIDGFLHLNKVTQILKINF